MSSIEFQFPKAQRRLEEAQEQLEAQKEALRRAQQIVHDRELELMQAAVKDGVVATTATAATVALNPATAAKVLLTCSTLRSLTANLFSGWCSFYGSSKDDDDRSSWLEAAPPGWRNCSWGSSQHPLSCGFDQNETSGDAEILSLIILC